MSRPESTVPQSAAYVVEVEREGCERCGVGKMWIVVDPNGVGGSVTYGDPDEAEHVAEDLNEAYDLGKRSHDASPSLMEEAREALRAFVRWHDVPAPAPTTGCGLMLLDAERDSLYDAARAILAKLDEVGR